MKREEEEANKVHGGSKRHPILVTPIVPPVGNTSSSILGLFKVNARNDVTAMICSFFYANGIPFNVPMSPFWFEMVKAINEAPKGYKPPSSEKIRTTLLDKEKYKVGEDESSIALFGICAHPHYYSQAWLRGGPQRRKHHADPYVDQLYLNVVERMVSEPLERVMIRQQLSDYLSNKGGTFAQPQAIADRVTMLALAWWDMEHNLLYDACVASLGNINLSSQAEGSSSNAQEQAGPTPILSKSQQRKIKRRNHAVEWRPQGNTTSQENVEEAPAVTDVLVETAPVETTPPLTVEVLETLPNPITDIVAIPRQQANIVNPPLKLVMLWSSLSQIIPVYRKKNRCNSWKWQWTLTFLSLL
ncbi:hypothetical protein IFM89_023239 [Coptis chinensis]|uniref:Uncharacterized protein n=1 Tax=Coptis chinensis TaxID=261450 RepID=A0A835M0T5_9MAGN|nr:hypothetical protein IFM89_023239 [Coptis chinensis]